MTLVHDEYNVHSIRQSRRSIYTERLKAYIVETKCHCLIVYASTNRFPGSNYIDLKYIWNFALFSLIVAILIIT